MMGNLKGAFSGCSWCHGDGCNQCHIERKKAEDKFGDEMENPKPIFSAKLDNPHDMQLMKQYFGKDALEHAFNEDGNGAKELEANGCIASLLQALHNQNPEFKDSPNA